MRLPAIHIRANAIPEVDLDKRNLTSRSETEGASTRRLRDVSVITGKARRVRKKSKKAKASEANSEAEASTRSTLLLEDVAIPRSAQGFINPTNIEEMRNRFLHSPHDEDPIFEYLDEKRCEALFKAFSVPHTEFLDAARTVMEACLSKFGSESRYLTEVGDMIVDKERCCQEIGAWLKANGLDSEVKLHFNTNSVAAASMQGNIFHIAVPVQIRLHRLSSVCNHEIGTHYLRGANEKLQRWHKRREKFGLGDHLVSEEGLACLNTHLEGDKHMWKAALHYYTAVQASRMSFTDLFRDLAQYLDDPENVWRQCVRFKRGLRDTSRPGAYCRDQCYFEGAMRLLQQRKTVNFQQFHRGKITIEGFQYVKERVITHGTRLPHFLQDIDRYRALLEEIVDVNALREYVGDGTTEATVLFRRTHGILRGSPHTHGSLTCVGRTEHAFILVIFEVSG